MFYKQPYTGATVAKAKGRLRCPLKGVETGEYVIEKAIYQGDQSISQ